MANVNVTYQEMNDAATKLNAGKDEMNQKLADLKAYIGNLVSSGFVTDQASVRFNETYQEYTTGATQTISALEGLASYLKQAAQALGDVDSQLAAGLG